MARALTTLPPQYFSALALSTTSGLSSSAFSPSLRIAQPSNRTNTPFYLSHHFYQQVRKNSRDLPKKKKKWIADIGENRETIPKILQWPSQGTQSHEHPAPWLHLIDMSYTQLSSLLLQPFLADTDVWFAWSTLHSSHTSAKTARGKKKSLNDGQTI